MFHSQAAVGLALLPVAWAASDRAASDRAASDPEATPCDRGSRADFVRHFPAGWSRDTVPDFLAAAARVLARVKSRWQSSVLSARAAR
jgi:hypothetical protein